MPVMLALFDEALFVAAVMTSDNHLRALREQLLSAPPPERRLRRTSKPPRLHRKDAPHLMWDPWPATSCPAACSAAASAACSAPCASPATSWRLPRGGSTSSRRLAHVRGAVHELHRHVEEPVAAQLQNQLSTPLFTRVLGDAKG